MAAANHLFQFKQFYIDQTDCPMRINTDGVLLGALASHDQASSILDVGTGTGVIALMLAQRYTAAKIWGVEIDASAAQRAADNFVHSPFFDRLSCVHQDVLSWDTDLLFDLIVSNPPFFLNALKNPDQRRGVAKHANDELFDGLLFFSQAHLRPQGKLQLIIPFDLAEWLTKKALAYGLFCVGRVDVQSFNTSSAIRSILSFSNNATAEDRTKLIIYRDKGEHSEDYKKILSPYFLAF